MFKVNAVIVEAVIALQSTAKNCIFFVFLAEAIVLWQIFSQNAWYALALRKALSRALFVTVEAIETSAHDEPLMDGQS